MAESDRNARLGRKSPKVRLPLLPSIVSAAVRHGMLRCRLTANKLLCGLYNLQI